MIKITLLFAACVLLAALPLSVVLCAGTDQTGSSPEEYLGKVVEVEIGFDVEVMAIPMFLVPPLHHKVEIYTVRTHTGTVIRQLSESSTNGTKPAIGKIMWRCSDGTYRFN